MNHPNDLPIHRVGNGPKPNFQRHHTFRYYAHRVKESLTTRIFKFICTIFLFILFFLGLIAFIVWLSLRPHRPRFHIEDFSIPGLAQAQQTVAPESVAVNMNVTIRNPNHKVVYHYDSIQCVIFYQGQIVGGTPLVAEPFDQGSKNTTILTTGLGGPILAINTSHWMQMQRDFAAGKVQFRLQITSVIKFEIQSWGKTTKKHKLHVNCAAPVGPDGSVLHNLTDKRCPAYYT
ncbi:hypothetical protein BVRB_8g187240 [Beta vulgaris subsp. vulgaris]|nr:hypothetical protein BVRB_8g187240 [Beta vulgaris subsp. vulgaris]